MPTIQLRFTHGFVLLCTLLSACTQLPPASHCGAWAYGVVGLREDHPYQHCASPGQEANLQMKDFSDDDFLITFERGDNSVVSNPSSSRNRQTSHPAISRVLDAHRFDDEAWSLVLPSGWVQAVSPSGFYQHYAYHENLQAGLFVSAYGLNPFPIFSEVSSSLMDRLEIDSELIKGARSASRRFDRAGVETYRQEMRGVDKHGFYLHYSGRTIFTKNKIIYIAVWCPEEQFAQNRAQFEQLMDSLRIADRELSLAATGR